MKKTIIIFFVFASMLFSQDLTGVRICIDPGHGGHEGDDRYIEATGFWESESNLTKGLELRTILLDLGANVAITRTGNNGTTDDPSLSERVGLANSFNADYFTSIHSNGFNGTANYTMVIYNGHTNSPAYPLARTMALIMAPNIHAVDYTTSDLAIGDLTLNPSWSHGYGVLYPANMPATISEGSFHDYIPESWRLMNLDYRRHEARAIARSFLEYFSEPGFPNGAIAGLVRDAEELVDYFHFTSLGDQRLPINGIQVNVEPGGLSYTGNDNNNGYFCIDDLAPGEYEITVTAAGYAVDSSTVSVSSNTTTISNFVLQNNAPPIIVSSEPADGDTTYPAWDIPNFTFSKAMDEASVEAAFTITPHIDGTFYFAPDSKLMAYLISDTLAYLTDYTITIAGTAMGASGFYLDGNQDGTGGDDWTIWFRTSPPDDTAPVILDTYPVSGSELVDLRPIFNIVWDEELEPETIINDRIKLERIQDLQLQETVIEHHVINGQSILVLYTMHDLLDAEDYRVRIFPGFEDLFGNIQSSGTLISFTTSNFDYNIVSIDNFENDLTSNWWQPSSSGSTTGEIGVETAMSSSTDLTIMNSGSETAMALNYGWNPAAGSWLIREYLNTGAPQNVHFSSSKIMQAYVFGDDNGNQLRFCVDDNVTGSGAHEVSPWYTIDWYGWRLISWDMAVDGTGTWIGDGNLDGTLRFDSFQLTYVPGQPNIGVYYIDELRVVDRNYLALDDPHIQRPAELALLPNYPNPFNPWTSIPFTLPEQAEVQISIYDLRGAEVAHIFSGSLDAGRHVTRWNAAQVSSGLYLVKLEANDVSITRKITVLK